MRFSVEGAAPRPASGAPELVLQVALDDAAHQGIWLRCQVQIDAARRRYAPAEADGLRDLFGAPHRFTQTLRPIVWTHATVGIPPGVTSVELPLPCGFDFTVAANTYFAALDGGAVPLVLLFSGTVFAAGANGLEVGPLPSTAEARFDLPLSAWRDTLARHYPDWAPLALGRDVRERLARFKQARELRTFDDAILALLASAERT